nr:MAG TPA: Single stranded DNA binding protein [Caudoviricetes sp.]
MENNEKQELNEEVGMVVSAQGGNVMSFEEMRNNSNTNCQIYTNITDKKKLFNLESKVDNLLNDCEGEMIRVKGVLLKIYKKPMKEPIINEETGEIEKDTETTMSCVLLDDNGKSYATGSKMFAIQLMRYIQNWGMAEFEEGLEIKIVKNKMSNSNNKALGFELV